MIIKRDLYLSKIIERKHNGLIKIVTGIRRCGKSFLLNELFLTHLEESGVPKDHIIRMSLEGLMNQAYRDPLTAYKFITEQILDSEIHYIIIDEVQMMNDFTEVLISLLQIRNLDIYVTGSNSRFLSSDIATEFRGRGDIIQLHPLRFSEFSSVYSSREEAWDDYFTYGGMPLVLSYTSRESKEEYLRNLFTSTYMMDIVERNNLQDESNLGELVNVLASGIGSYTNPTKLEKTFLSVKKEKFSHNTIDRYISFLEDAFIISKAQRYDVKGKKYIGTPYKIYFEDTGLRNARLDFRQVEENHLMENILYNDLVARGYRVDVGTAAGFSRDETGKTIRKEYEIDFVVNRGSEKYYIQSAYQIPDEGKMMQEKRSLLQAKDAFRKIIITGNYMKEKIDEDGIIHIGLLNFLLEDRMPG